MREKASPQLTFTFVQRNLRGLSRINTNRQNLQVLHDDYFTGLNDVKYINKREPPSTSACFKFCNGGSHKVHWMTLVILPS